MSHPFTAVSPLLAASLAVALAACGGGGGSAGPSGPPDAPPTNLTASYASAREIHLAWTNNAAGATGNRVERATSAGGPFATLATAAASASGYADVGVAISTQYYYRVTAVAVAGPGTPSAVATVAPPPVPTAPLAPTGVAASSQPGSTLQVAWSHGGANVSGFTVERLINWTGYTWTKVADLPPAARSYSDPCLPPGYPFLYRVTAVNEVGSATATSAQVTTPAPSAAPAPTSGPSSLTATALSDTSYRVSWTNGCTTADRIQVEYADGPGYGTWTNILGGTNAFSADASWFIYTDLPVGLQRRVRVKAWNTLGSTNYTAAVQVNGPAAPPPAAGGSVGIYADYDNTKVYSDIVPSLGNTVSSSGGLTAGCFWSYNTFLAMQDFNCYSAALHFPLSGTTAGGAAFNLAGKTIDRAILALNVSGLSVDRTNLSITAIASAWSTATLNGNTSLQLYSSGSSVQGSPLALGPYTFDVTAIVQAWASGAFVNHGLLLEDAEYVFPYGDYIRTSFFHSTDAYGTDQTRRPTLWVDFR